MYVDPNTFVSAMSEHWSNRLGNVVSNALKDVWHLMATVFNRQIADSQDSKEEWQVLQPPTGTGKTQGLAVYCSMLKEENHPGVLIVTRLKAQADDLAKAINDRSGRPVAIAKHSDNVVSPEELKLIPVVIITHKAFEIGLDSVTRFSPSQAWQAFHAFRNGRRGLVVIDEALDIIEAGRVDLEDVRLLRAIIPEEIRKDFKEELNVLENLESRLVSFAESEQDPEKVHKDKIVSTRGIGGGIADLSNIDLSELRNALKHVRLDTCLSKVSDANENRRQQERFDKVLKSIQMALDQWSWYAKLGNKHTFNSARVIVPEQGLGAVVLDATASSNLIYSLFEGRVSVRPVPKGARNYSNVTVHVSSGHRVGKNYLENNAALECPRLVSNIKQALGDKRKVFFCCHKKVEPYLLGYDTSFDEVGVGHWGAIDGRNDWQEFDTAVIFGLPYRDRAWPMDTFMAVQGVQSNDWLAATGDRPFAGHRDICHALEVGQLSVSVVQAINRVRCRRVIDVHGNCAPTDVFLLLPNSKVGEDLMQRIKEEMPGVQVREWKYAHAVRKAQKSKHEEALLSYMESMPRGRISKSEIMNILSIPKKSMEWLIKRIKDEASDFAQRLRANEVRYEVTGVGRGAQSHFVKA